ncbi:MAG: ABC transporter permease [Deltaproteobacteria bacterium]|nr:ABC transporter permease [Deltaproteobacteria bacterium]
MNSFKLAWRNVWRNRRRSVVTILAMSLALFAMVQYSGFMRGYQLDLSNSAVNVEMGHIQIHAKGYLDRPSMYKNIPAAQKPATRIEQLGPGIFASSRILGSGLLASADNSAAAMFRGLDVAKDKRVSDIYKRVNNGQWLDAKDPGGVVIGARLARILNVKIGDELIFLTQAADGSTANQLFTLRGTVTGAGENVERAGVFMNLNRLSDFLAMENAHQIMVRTSDDADLNALKNKIQMMAPRLTVNTWKEIAPELASMIDYMSSVLFFMYILVYISIGIVVLNAMLMAVFERIREFGIMKAIGVSPIGVFQMIVVETAIMLGCSLLAATVLCIPMSIYLSTCGIDLSSQMSTMSVSGVGVNPVMKAVFDVPTVVAPLVVLTLVVFGAIVYPALKAALLQPVNAIHHQ